MRASEGQGVKAEDRGVDGLSVVLGQWEKAGQP